MKIYEITQAIDSVFDASPSGEISDADRLVIDALEMDLNDKLVNVAKVAVNNDAEVGMIDLQIQKLNDKKRVLKNRVTSARKFLLDQMTSNGILEVKGDTVTAKTKMNPPAVKIENEDLIPGMFKKPQPDKIDVAGIRTALKKKQDVPGCRLVSGLGLTIK